MFMHRKYNARYRHRHCCRIFGLRPIYPSSELLDRLHEQNTTILLCPAQLQQVCVKAWRPLDCEVQVGRMHTNNRRNKTRFTSQSLRSNWNKKEEIGLGSGGLRKPVYALEIQCTLQARPLLQDFWTSSYLYINRISAQGQVIRHRFVKRSP